MKPESQAKVNNMINFAQLAAKKLDEKAEKDLDDEKVDLKIRIARASILIAQGVEKATPEKVNLVGLALGLLGQAQAVADLDSSLALRLFNRARSISRTK